MSDDLNRQHAAAYQTHTGPLNHAITRCARTSMNFAREKCVCAVSGRAAAASARTRRFACVRQREARQGQHTITANAGPWCWHGAPVLLRWALESPQCIPQRWYSSRRRHHQHRDHQHHAQPPALRAVDVRREPIPHDAGEAVLSPSLDHARPCTRTCRANTQQTRVNAKDSSNTTVTDGNAWRGVAWRGIAPHKYKSVVAG